jgi:hypothetical protein
MPGQAQYAPGIELIAEKFGQIGSFEKRDQQRSLPKPGMRNSKQHE